eukprot:s572_g22.t1
MVMEQGQPTVWILHMFSGRRRRGDCHFWVECFQGFIPGVRVRILSVDTAVHRERGNLDRGIVFTTLLRIIRKKFFASGLTGPPCETFSAARHIELPGERHPRPLRSAQHPWLLARRSGREFYQTLIGTRLLLHSVIAETELVLAGGRSIMEHPSQHPDQARASVVAKALASETNPIAVRPLVPLRGVGVMALFEPQQPKNTHLTFAERWSMPPWQVWDLKQKKEVISFQDPASRLRCSSVAWHPEVPTQLVVCYDDDRQPSMQMWDLRNCQYPFKETAPHTKGVLSVAWNQMDPNLILSCGKDNRVICTSIASGSPETWCEMSAQQHSFEVEWAPHKAALFSAASSGTVGIYSVQQQQNAGKYCPRWYRKRCGAGFGFGGKLLSFGAKAEHEGKNSTKNRRYSYS